MCLIELTDCKLPWTNCCPPALVTAKVTQGEMHLLEPQLARAEAPMAELARRCWATEPMERPSFPEIVVQLEDLMGVPSDGVAAQAPAPIIARPEPPPPPGPPMDGCSFVRSRVDRSTDADRTTWREVQARIAESLPEYTVSRIDRLQNLELWRHYFLFCFDLEHAVSRGPRARLGAGGINEHTLFHWAPPKAFDQISGEEGSGFETRL
eukprot:COSAG01_NODE_14943_length_1393_cov_1.132921_2_plen_208_part_01